jgi:hypothetical protein
VCLNKPNYCAFRRQSNPHKLFLPFAFATWFRVAVSAADGLGQLPSAVSIVKETATPPLEKIISVSVGPHNTTQTINLTAQFDQQQNLNDDDPSC